MPQSEEMLARCAALRSAGFVLSVRERPESLDQGRPLLKLAEIIKVDISHIEPDRLKQLMTGLQATR